MIDFHNCRNVPKDPVDRYYGEGDLVLRDSEGRIIAWSVGTDDKTWEKLLKENPGSFESVAMYDIKGGGVR